MIRCRSHRTPAFTTSLSLTDQRSCRYSVLILCSGEATSAETGAFATVASGVVQ